MKKILIIGSAILVVVIIIGLLAWRQSQSKPTNTNQLTGSGEDQSSQSQSEALRLQTLEDTMSLVAQKVINLPSYSQPSNSNLEGRVVTLEQTVSNLQKQVDSLKLTPTQQTSNSTTTKTPVYIPLGWSGTTTALDWTSLPTQTIFINSDDYPGMSGVTFEAKLRAYQGSGTAFARLFNKDDNVTVTSSDVSTTSSDYNWVSSVRFSLATGKKTYVLQLKTLTSYMADIQDARLKISF